jgi:hypothetical protein
MAHDFREVLRVSTGLEMQPTAVVIDSRTLQSTPDSGHRVGYDGARRRRDPRSTSPSTRWVTSKNVELSYVD